MKLAKNLISINWIIEKMRDRPSSGTGISRSALAAFHSASCGWPVETVARGVCPYI